MKEIKRFKEMTQKERMEVITRQKRLMDGIIEPFLKGDFKELRENLENYKKWVRFKGYDYEEVGIGRDVDDIEGIRQAVDEWRKWKYIKGKDEKSEGWEEYKLTEEEANELEVFRDIEEADRFEEYGEHR